MLWDIKKRYSYKIPAKKKYKKLRVGIVYFHTRAKLLGRSTKDTGEARKLANGKII